MKLVIDLPDEVVKWFKGKGFIPIGQYLTVDEAMKKAEPLSEVLAEIKGEIEQMPVVLLNGFDHIDRTDTLEIIDKHISGKGNKEC